MMSTGPTARTRRHPHGQTNTTKIRQNTANTPNKYDKNTATGSTNTTNTAFGANKYGFLREERKEKREEWSCAPFKV